MNETYLYPYSAKEARERNELSLWRESHRANIACRDAIEDTIRRSFDGMHLNEDCLAPVLTAYEIPQCDWSSDVCSSDLRRVGIEIGFIHLDLSPRFFFECPRYHLS